MEQQGKIIKVLPMQSGQGKNGEWKRQEFVMEYGDRFPKLLCFSLRGEKIDQYPLAIDDSVVVSFDIESREFNGRYYTNCNAWKIEKAGESANQNFGPAASAAPAAPQAAPASDDSKDDLPF